MIKDVIDDGLIEEPVIPANVEPKETKKAEKKPQTIEDIEDAILGEFNPNRKQPKANEEDESDDTPKPKSKSAKNGDIDAKALYQFLKDNKFTKAEIGEEDELDVDKLSKMVKKEKSKAVKTKMDAKYQKEVEDFISDLDTRGKGILKHLLEGGDAEEYFNKGLVSSVQELTPEKITDDNAEKYLRDFYKRSNVPAKQIDKLITKHKDLAELADVMKDNLDDYKEMDKTAREKEASSLRERKEQEKRNEESRKAAIENNIKSMKEFLGIKVTDTMRNKIAEETTKMETLGKINKDLATYLPRLRFLDLLGVLDGKSDKLEKVFGSKVANDIKEKTKNLPFMNTGNAERFEAPSGKKEVADSVMAQLMSFGY